MVTNLNLHGTVSLAKTGLSVIRDPVQIAPERGL
jgi:hypothetical protein